MLSTIFILAAGAVLAEAQAGINGSFPHAYPGQPEGDYSPRWQKYFEVTKPLPNVTFPVARSFAGNIRVNRPHHPNDTLFYWGFEHSHGSLTAGSGQNAHAPWAIWLNGGPGSSSMPGLTLENGPIHINPDYSVTHNPYAWTAFADYFWIDQPVGVGFSTSDAESYVTDEDQMATDFFGFLENLVKVFPSLRTRPLYLTGESYAGTYIPYITKHYFGLKNPPVRLARIAMGDGSYADQSIVTLLPVVQIIETYPQIIGYNSTVFEYFREQEHLCGYDLNLTYPQTKPLPPVSFAGSPSDDGSKQHLKFLSKKPTRFDLAKRLADGHALRKRDDASANSLRSFDPHSPLDPFYGCDIYDEVMDYALNFTFPWNLTQGFDVYDIPDALNPEVPMDPSVFFNDPKTVAALHAPTSKEWTFFFSGNVGYPFGGNFVDPEDPSPSPEPAFFSELATNASLHHVSIVFYSGNDDSLVPHRGTEVVIQNTTFGGIRGFTRRPSTPWTLDNGTFGGIVHQERNWTYVLINNAGHVVPYTNPISAFTMARNWIFGNNQTGLVVGSKVIGGENASELSGDILPGNEAIFYGSLSTQSSYVFPTATINSWSSFIHTATATATP
ncbi:alpha/beta-hydrolase [Punctularia strigosozonata HHB-11173 SS5]|uniref:Carboxypeptidase n=1 Tax=Punctularia strigosozonata (strain HHB-11173) TaxID=741275 RepID=R7S168_PUNST|nr:alpha/beta-hydrolase [Punctularia strigosozonata HHB-11173 SS5]EIN03589.1 alpha/beta-hydrolase [Punctularia strigosozonata HHB-11173 SS5]